MRRLSCLAAVLVLAGCGGGASGPGGGAAGLPGTLPEGAVIAAENRQAAHAPDFDLTLLDGTRVKASSLWRTRPVVLDFLASWCDRCADRQDGLNDLARRYAGLVAFVGVAHEDDADALRTYLKGHHVPYAAGIDGSGTTWRSYAVDEPPVVAVVGKGGRLLRGWTVDVPEQTLDGVLRGLAKRTG